MFFEIGIIDDQQRYICDPDLSHILSKHPDSIYHRQDGFIARHGEYMSVVEATLEQDDREIVIDSNVFTTEIFECTFGQIYRGYLTVDPLEFVRIGRQGNKSSYVSADMDVITASNLVAFAEMFRTAIHNKFNVDHVNVIDSEQPDVYAKKNMRMIIGPAQLRLQHDSKFRDNKDRITGSWIKHAFTAYDIDCIGCPQKYISDEKYVMSGKTVMLDLRSHIPMTVTEFLQKVFLILLSFVYCVDVNKQRAERYIRVCSDWINHGHDGVIKQELLRRLSGRDLTIEKVLKLECAENEAETEAVVEHFEHLGKRGELHKLRHSCILSLIDQYVEQNRLNKKTVKILDIGCAEGKLYEKLKSKGYENSYGFDCSVRFRGYSRHIKMMNVLVPHMSPEYLNADIIVISEVIEHFEEKERKRLLKVIRDVFMPKCIIITTPNYDYNIFYENLISASEKEMNIVKYRHPDHKIEFTQSQLQSEVLDYLQLQYNVTFVELEPDKDIQQSFVAICHRNENYVEMDKGMYVQLQQQYSRIFLPFSRQSITESELMCGYADRAYRMNASNIFYLKSTMAPVNHSSLYKEYKREYCLEHPYSGFDYYSIHGIRTVCCEHKEMGSYGALCVFKDEAIAQQLGYAKIMLLSRGGYSFFDANDPRLEQLYQDVHKTLVRRKLDFVILEGEVKPWILKSEYGLDKQFIVPGEARLLQTAYTGQSTMNAEKYLEALQHYIQDTAFEFVSFGVLAEGQIKVKAAHNNYLERIVFDRYIRGQCINQERKHQILAEYTGECIRPVQHCIVDISTVSGCEEGLKFWSTYCQEGGEGVVIKPYESFELNTNGYMIVPELKVRGREYLRLIYGIDMYEEDCFEYISHRNIKQKRLQSVVECELGYNILTAFLENQHTICHQYIAAFLGIERLHFADVDKTL